MKILAVDYGDARTGLAVCDQQELLARPLETVKHWDPRRLAEEIARLARREGAEKLVVGHPVNMDGTQGPRAEKCREFARILRDASGLPTTLWDERQTTVAAGRSLTEAGVFGQRRKKLIDAVAATVILEAYLRWRLNHPGEEDPNGTL